VSSDELTPLVERLARARGIGESYYSYKGELKQFSLTTKAAILRAMHCRLDDVAALREQIGASESVHPAGLLGEVAVLRSGARAVRINTPAIEHNARLGWIVHLEGGGEVSGEVRAWDLPERGAHQNQGRWWMLRDLPLPATLPWGYHRLEVDLERFGRENCPLIVAPDKCYEPADIAGGAKFWGAAVQLYALRSEHNWGIGDFTDLAELLRLAAGAGAGFVGISPVHALFFSDPMLYSPYSASSRHALNVMFIDAEAVLEVQGSRRAQAIMADAGFRARLAAVRAATHVDYQAVGSLKLAVLQAAFERFRTEHSTRHTARAAACRDFLRERGEPMRLHTLFEALDTHLRRLHGSGAGWHSWPEEYRNPESAAVRQFAQQHADEVDFHGYLQWIASEQLGAVRALARELKLSVGVYGDYAVGVNASGSETWSDQSLYCMGAAIGAPPDPIGVGGQEWGIPPQDPRQLRLTAYAPFVALVRASMRNCGALRLDHVMALFRQWWVPRGFKSADGGYVHYPLDDLLGVVALESHRQQCLVVGEDLGVVPDEIRRALPQYSVYHYKVVLFEQKNGEFVPPGDYTRQALAVATTHDLPTLNGWWSGHDIDLWEKLGFYAEPSVGERMRAERRADRERLLRALRRENLWPVAADADADAEAVLPAYSPQLGRALHVYLGRAKSILVTVQLEDMIGMLEPVNVPGTSHEYSNWTRRMTASAREIFLRPDVHALAAALLEARSL
jgi:4-alpha-glucanotransferase